MFDKILVPLDMSKLAEQVLQPALQLAQAFNSEIHLINVCEAHNDAQRTACEPYIVEIVERIESQAYTRIKSRVITGRPDRQIMEYAKVEKMNLILMSSHGRSGVMLWPIGGTVDRVLRSTGIPLIVVNVKEPAKAEGSRNLFQKILVTLDGSERGANVLPYVKEIARSLGSEITLLHVIDTEQHVRNLGRIDTVPILHDEMGMLREKGETYLAQQSALLREGGSKVSTVVTSGNVAKEIVDYARAHGTTLIAMSSHGHSGFESWVIGSVTNKVLHAANKSVFFVPAIEES